VEWLTRDWGATPRSRGPCSSPDGREIPTEMSEFISRTDCGSPDRDARKRPGTAGDSGYA
jgi:hypothetical protein